MVDGNDNSGLANHLIRWRQVNVWDYYVEECLLGEGSIGKISLVHRRRGTEGGSAYISGRSKMGQTNGKKEDGGNVVRCCGGFFGRFLPKKTPPGIEKTSTGPSRHSEKFALKSIQLRLVEKKYLEELRNEIDVLRDLDHPNVVKAYEVYETKTNIFVVMEYLSGGDLYARAPYTESQCAPVISQICSAIFFMHKHGVVHRDLKVENVMYESKEPAAKIKVLDFGLSKKFLPGSRGIMREWAGTIYTMSPQVLNGTYNYKADCWAIGVLSFLLLADEKPFRGKNKKEVMQNIKQCNYNFNAAAWKQVSQVAKDFVSSLLVYDSEKRLSAEAALQHTWLNKTEVEPSTERRESHELMKDVRDCIMAYKGASEMKKIAAVVVAHKSSSAEILDIRRAFDKYDKAKDGMISMEEFKLALAEFNYSDEELNDMFSKMDVNHNGVILYTEFIAATLEIRGKVEEKRLAEAFDLIDDDDSGFITQADLTKLLGSNVPQARVDALIKETDKDKDGMISFEEFLKMFRDDNTKRLSTVIEALPYQSNAVGDEKMH